MTVDEAAALLSKKAALVARIRPVEKTAQPEWLKNLWPTSRPEWADTIGTNLQKGWDNPYIRNALLGAGGGATIGIFADRARDKGKRHPWRSALRGAIAGAGIGAGGTYLWKGQKPGPSEPPPESDEARLKKVQRILSGKVAPGPGTRGVTGSDIALGAGTGAGYQAQRRARMAVPRAVPGGANASAIQIAARGAEKSDILKGIHGDRVIRAMTNPETARDISRQLNAGQNWVSVKEPVVGSRGATSMRSIGRMTAAQLDDILTQGIHAERSSAVTPLKGGKPTVSFSKSRGPMVGGRPALSRSMFGRVKIPNTRYGLSTGIPQTVAAMSLPYLIRTFGGNLANASNMATGNLVGKLRALSEGRKMLQDPNASNDVKNVIRKQLGDISLVPFR